MMQISEIALKITFEMSLFAIYTKNPTKSREVALERVGQYLKAQWKSYWYYYPKLL